MKKVLALSLIVLFPFIFLKLPNEEVSAGVLAPIFFALFAISCITEIYKRVKHKEENIKISYKIIWLLLLEIVPLQD